MVYPPSFIKLYQREFRNGLVLRPARHSGWRRGQRRATDFAPLLSGVSANTSNGNLTTSTRASRSVISATSSSSPARTIGISTGGLHEGTRLVLQADMFNVTNHTHFVYSALNTPLSSWTGPTLAQLGTSGAPAFSSSYGQLSVDSGAPTNRAVQLAARIEF